eukprot:TRINITY_DN24516_c0_g1_i1.p1 TRINITY_DN24516_c0_g1~~TRINITY_DN24516_c0_g1_i1.p1  ORF type:complete len:427 (+),score=77.15 TRINITY_DN24516_c0_g1_i1:140-1282(+)
MVQLMCNNENSEKLRPLAANGMGFKIINSDTAPSEVSKPPPQDTPKQTYFIGNLPRKTPVKQLEDSLRKALLETSGAKITMLKILKDDLGEGNGCAVVQFGKQKQETAAVQNINNGKVQVNGRILRVEVKQSKDDLQSRVLIGDKNTVFAANLPISIGEPEIHTVFSKFGDVKNITMNYAVEGTFNGTARITYPDPASVLKATQHSGVLLVNRRPVRVDLDKRKAARNAQLDLTGADSVAKSVIVSPIDSDKILSVASTKQLFSGIGRIKYARRPTPAEGTDNSVIICFTSPACVAVATQMVGREVSCSDETKIGILVKIINTSAAEDKARKPKEVVFTFGGARHWNNKEYAKQMRIQELESWNNKSSGDNTWNNSSWTW